MFSVLVVDDENPVIESITYMLEKYRPEIEIAGTAKSGREAIEKAETMKPDIILIDVRMPGIDGLEAIRVMKRSNPAVIPIITTAYERFDIAQTAFEIGVHDYILKPFSRSKLTSAIDSAVQVLSQRPGIGREDLKSLELVEHISPIMEKLFFRSFLFGLETEPFRDIFLHTLGIDISYGSIAVMWGIFTNQRWAYEKKEHETSGEVPETKATRSSHESTDKIIETVKFKYRCLSAQVGEELLFFFPAENGVSTAPEEEAFLRTLDSAGVYTTDILFMCGEAVETAELRTSYLKIREKRRKSGNTKVEGDDQRSLRSKRGEELISAFRKENREVFSELLEEYVYEYGKEGTHNSAVHLAALTASVERELRIETEYPESFYPGSELPVLLSSCMSWGKILFEKRRKQDIEAIPSNLKKAYEYIDEFFGEPVQLADVADALRISPSYLSRLFTTFGKTSFVDYLTHVRIERAKELLRKGDLSIKEISIRVGYQDPNYFSRIFKKATGTSPSEFPA